MTASFLNQLYDVCRCTWPVARHWVAAVPRMPPCTCAAAQQIMTAGSWTGGHPMMSCPGLSMGRQTAKVGMQQMSCLQGREHAAHNGVFCRAVRGVVLQSSRGVTQRPGPPCVQHTQLPAPADVVLWRCSKQTHPCYPCHALVSNVELHSGVLCCAVVCRCFQVPWQLRLHEG
jgi:hypothetical protein